MRRLAWKTSMVCLTLAGWTALIAALAPAARSAQGWTWPARGEVITHYANDDARPYAGGMHRGIDIAAPTGAPVVAARSGEVTYAGNLGYSGITVAVRSADGRHVASYLHLSAVSVRRGESVAAGERVGEVGTTGRRSVAEPHLHFGVRLADQEHGYVDPLSLLPPPVARAQAPAGQPPVTAPVAPRLEPAPAVAAAPARRPVRHSRRVPSHVAAPRSPVIVTTPGTARAPSAVPARSRRSARVSGERLPAVVRRPGAAQVRAGRSAASPAVQTAREAGPLDAGGGAMGRLLLWAGLAVVALAGVGPVALRSLAAVRLPRLRPGIPGRRTAARPCL